MRTVIALIRELRPLVFVHALLMLLTIILPFVAPSPSDVSITDASFADFKVQSVWLFFLIPGWLVAPRWTPKHSGFGRKYFAATIVSVGLHGVLVAAGATLDLPLSAYAPVFALVTLLCAVDRFRCLRQDLTSGLAASQREIAATQSRFAKTREAWGGRIAILALIVVSVTVYRTPRSNDIRQFLLQQQDMVAEDSMRVSAIGMTAIGVDEPMPRWKAHQWHVLPCVISIVSQVPVDLLLFRFGTIPLAFSVLVCLCFIVCELAGRGTYTWIALLVIFGPVILGYRSFNAFNYSFRLTNSFWLDKDICLFFLIPSVVYLAYGWCRGKSHFTWPLILLVPAIVKFHPMTAVYLIGLTPVFAVWSLVKTGERLRRIAILGVAATGIFVTVFLIGDAQSYHREIREIVTLDYSNYQAGRPLHYWDGLYAAIPDTGMEIDTTLWSGDVFHLKMSVITNCGLLLTAHVFFVFGIILWIASRLSKRIRRRVLGLGVTLVCLWCIYFGSRFVLTAAPHLSGGVERLHWFAYLPCLVGISAVVNAILGLSKNLRPGISIIASNLIAFLLIVSGWNYVWDKQAPLTKIRGLNSLLDFELLYNKQRQAYLSRKSPIAPITPTRPPFLAPDDVVLLLEIKGRDTFWWIKQGRFWSDSYAEAFALSRRGEEFLNDRKHFYALVDHRPLDTTEQWIREKGITLMIDRRDGGDRFLRKMFESIEIDAEHLREGVWRINP